MKKIGFILILFLAVPLYSQNEEVKQAVVTFFKGFHAKDSTVMKSVCADSMILQTISESAKGTQIKNLVVSDFFRSIVSIPATMLFEEKLVDYTIQVDGALAQVWTPYEFYVNGKISHKGVNAFTLLKQQDQWKIIYTIDTRRK